MAHIVCSVPGCRAEAIIVLNNQPVCRSHCEEFAKHALVLGMSVRDVLKQPLTEPARTIAAPD